MCGCGLNHWKLYDNTGDNPHLIAEEMDGRFSVTDTEKLAKLERAANVSFMPDEPSPTVQEAAVYVPSPDTRASMRAMRKAYADAVLENLRFGLPVIQYIDGKVVETPAEQLAPRAREILAANGEYLPGETKPPGW